MKVREINNKDIWENFILDCDEKTFLSSWNWGEFNKMMGNKIWRLGIFENNELFSVASVIKIAAKRGTFLFLPHGPVTKYEIGSMRHEVLKVLLEELKKIAQEEKASLIRISPIWERNEENIKVFKDLGFRDASIHMHPELTWELDITLPEDELLMNMRKTTRYLIRQAQKNKDIEISQSQKIDYNPPTSSEAPFRRVAGGLESHPALGGWAPDIEKFNDLYQETVDRHHFIPFSLEYLKNEFSAFNVDNKISIFFGKYKNEIISAGMFIFWQGIGFYHQGASSFKYSKIPVSYLLQWEAIKEAKNRGCKIYNFWGIAPTDSPRHPWAGLTLFKMGFGGYKKEYVKTQDLPLSLKYWLTYIFEKLRKQKRGL